MMVRLHFSRINVVLCLGVFTLILLHANHVDCSLEPSDIWAKYKPLAMDESWSLIPSRPRIGRRRGEIREETPPWEGEPMVSYPRRDTIPKVYPPDPLANHTRLKYVEDWRGEDVKDTLFDLPRDTQFPSSNLAKLITQREPTLVQSEVVRPTIIATSKSGSGPGPEKVLASYKVIVPIFVPAIKRKVPTTARPAVRFVKQQITEMVPVKNIVPVVKEVIKAEEVPQEITTDIVSTKGNPVPPNVNSAVRSNERLLSSMIQDVR